MTKRTKLLPMIDHEMSVSAAISEAFGVIEQLGQEMRDAFDNTPESLQNGGVGERRGEAADALEQIQEPDVPGILAELMVTWQTRRLSPSAMRRQTRGGKLADAVVTLNAVRDFLENVRDEADALVTDLESMISDAEAVEFPGMYG